MTSTGRQGLTESVAFRVAAASAPRFLRFVARVEKFPLLGGKEKETAVNEPQKLLKIGFDG
jgi:hypothetical protein